MNKNITIMVVEDEEMLMNVIVKRLRMNNLDTISCLSGAEALDYFDSGKEQPDAIWLDYHLPDMDGLSFMAVLKNEKHITNIPVFVISNSATPDKIKSMLALGAEKYLIKAEHRLDELITVITAFIQEHKPL